MCRLHRKRFVYYLRPFHDSEAPRKIVVVDSKQTARVTVALNSLIRLNTDAQQPPIRVERTGDMFKCVFLEMSDDNMQPNDR